jgi:hypothetical protein
VTCLHYFLHALYFLIICNALLFCVFKLLFLTFSVLFAYLLSIVSSRMSRGPRKNILFLWNPETWGPLNQMFEKQGHYVQKKGIPDYMWLCSQNLQPNCLFYYFFRSINNQIHKSQYVFISRFWVPCFHLNILLLLCTAAEYFLPARRTDAMVRAIAV